MLDIRKDIQSIKSAWSVLHAELKAGDLTPLYGHNRGRKTKAHTANVSVNLEIP